MGRGLGRLVPERRATGGCRFGWGDGLAQAVGVARGAQGTTFTGRSDEEIVCALPAANAGEAVRQDAASQVATKRPFHAQGSTAVNYERR